jgi:uncharacterized protein Yka (UPF0111/DUF47 family)
MTEEQIKQNAIEYRQCTDNPDDTIGRCMQRQEDFIAGAHSMLEEIELLKDMFSNSQRYAHSLKESVESMGKQLKNAVSLLYDILGDDDFFCTRLLDIDEEAKICEECCDNLNEKCILRYLKYYKKEQ